MNIIRTVVFLAGIFLTSALAFGQTTENEYTAHILEKYSNHFQKGETLWDGSQVDLRYKHTYPVEVDWLDRKWRESFAQAAWYADALESRPVIVLLVKDKTKEKHELMRVKSVWHSLFYKGHPFMIYVYDCKSGEFMKGFSSKLYPKDRGT